MLIKTAPLLDIPATLRVLKYVSQVHVVAVRNEVKEVLYRLDRGYAGEPSVTAVDLQSSSEEPFTFLRSEETSAVATYADPLTYLYEPHAALMKAGAFKLIAQRFGLSKLHPNTHLYTSDQPVPNFPGRTFRCRAVLPYRKKALPAYLPALKANVSTRNFPDPVATVRKRLGLVDGGNVYLFATRLKNGQLRLIITEKLV